ncbi:MAG: glycerol-3-phosphate dehydrogenase [Legionellaceae bacterium]
MNNTFDVVIVGGGINGAGCAADAALRGLSVLLCEKDDLASHTSSKSSQLIHGGLRYLEYFDIGMVKKSLDEQQHLLDVAPHLVHPLPFVLPHTEQTHPLWQLHTGLFLYDHLSFINALPNHQRLKRLKDPLYFAPLNDTLDDCFLYYDCQTNDARLVIENALQAQAAGATIMTNTALIEATPRNDEWFLTLQSKSGAEYHVRSKVVINASGPWANNLNTLLGLEQTPMTLIKGSHIVVPRCYEGNHAYLLQDGNKRIVFTIPFNGQTLVGTTEKKFEGNPDVIVIDDDEVDYLCSVVNHYFRVPIEAKDCITTWSGVRPLLSNQNKNATSLSRDYVYTISNKSAFAISIISGKITTYRQLAENVIDELKPLFPKLPPSPTKTTKLPGAHFNNKTMAEYQTHLEQTYFFVSHDVLSYYFKTYGALSEHILAPCLAQQSLGLHFGETLYQAEVDYLIQKEWATTLDDILWRRTKLGLDMDAKSRAHVSQYLSCSTKSC